MNINFVPATDIALAEFGSEGGIFPQGLKPKSVLWRLRHD
jgi:hypothetical protein